MGGVCSSSTKGASAAQPAAPNKSVVPAVLSPLMIKKLTRWFEVVDVDKNGSLTHSDFVAVVANITAYPGCPKALKQELSEGFDNWWKYEVSQGGATHVSLDTFLAQAAMSRCYPENLPNSIKSVAPTASLLFQAME